MNLQRDKQNIKAANKKLNKAEIFVLAYGAMIGWGWVVMSGQWISTAGMLGAILAFIAGGVIVLFVGQIYAELTASMSNGRGVLDFSSRGMGKRWSYICTWTLVLGYFSVIAFEAVALPTVLEYLIPDYSQIKLYTVSGFDVYATWLGVGIGSTAVIAFINYIGVKTAAFLQTFLTLFVAVVGIVLICGGISKGVPENPGPLFKNGFSGFAAVAAMTPFMYVGFDVIPQASQEMNIPKKQIGSILVLSVMMAVVWYLMIIVGVSLGLPAEEISTSKLATADAMYNIYGGSQFASKLLLCGGIAGIITCWNAFYIGGSRVICYMAQEGMLPAFLGKTHPKYKTPSNAILFLAALTLIAPFLGGNILQWLVNAGGLAMTAAYLMVSISFILLRKKEPGLERPYKIKHWKFCGIGSIILCILLSAMYMPGMPAALDWPYAWAIIFVWVVLGVVFYFCRNNKMKK